MPQKIHYLSLLIALVFLTGCGIINGAASGMNKDVSNAVGEGDFWPKPQFQPVF